MIIIIIIICILIFWLIVTHKYRCKTAELLLSEVQSFLRKLQNPQKLNVISFVYLVGPTMNVSWTFFSDWCDTNEQIVGNSRRLQALGSLHSGPFFVQHCKRNGFHDLCKSLHVIQNKLHMLQVFSEAIYYQYWSKQSTLHTSCPLPVIAAVHSIRVTSSITFEWPINHTKSACFTHTTIIITVPIIWHTH